MTLRQLKIQEFEDRKKLVHPYHRDAFLTDNSSTDKISNLDKKTKMSNMHTFRLSYNRHKGRYDRRVDDFSNSFPDRYNYNDAFIDMKDDPDWVDKIQPKRSNIKRFFITGLCIMVLVK